MRAKSAISVPKRDDGGFCLHFLSFKAKMAKGTYDLVIQAWEIINQFPVFLFNFPNKRQINSFLSLLKQTIVKSCLKQVKVSLCKAKTYERRLLAKVGFKVRKLLRIILLFCNYSSGSRHS